VTAGYAENGFKFFETRVLGCSKNKSSFFSKFLFIVYDVWEQSEGIGLKLDALRMRL
jgi:hypothetical protein